MDLVTSFESTLRFGNTIVVNPLGDKKLCSYDSVYDPLGPTLIRINQIKKEIEFPSVDAIEQALRNAITSAVEKDQKVETIVVSGNGEPTLYPEFDQLAERVKVVIKEAIPSATSVVITNGVHIDSRRMVEALNLFDERIVKVDAGSEKGYKAVNRPLVRGQLSKVTSGARKLNDCIVQAVFFKGSVTNLDVDEVDEWLEVVGIIQPKAIHIFTVTEGKTTEAGIIPATEDELYTVSSKFKRKSSVDLTVFYDPEKIVI